MENPNINPQEVSVDNQTTQKSEGFIKKITGMVAAGAILFSGAEKAQAQDGPLIKDKAVAAQNDKTKIDALREKLKNDAKGIQNTIDKVESIIEIKDIEEAISNSEGHLKALVEKHGKESVLKALKKQEESLQATIRKAEARLNEKQSESSISDQMEALKKITERFKAASDKISKVVPEVVNGK